MEGSSDNDKTRLKKAGKPGEEQAGNHKSENDSVWSKSDSSSASVHPDTSDKTRIAPKSSQEPSASSLEKPFASSLEKPLASSSRKPPQATSQTPPAVPSQKVYSPPPKPNRRQQKHLEQGITEKHPSDNDTRWTPEQKSKAELTTPPPADKTQLKPRVQKKPVASDKTRIAPPSSTSRSSTPQSSTPRPNTPQSNSVQSNSLQSNSLQSNSPQPGADKTVFARRKPPEQDATRIASVNKQNPVARDEGDKTRFAPPASIESQAASAANRSRRSSEQKTYEGKELLKNRFMLEEVLGAGGMGVVYKAKDLLKIEAQDRDPYVAIKVLSEEFKTHPEAFIALQRESRKSQRIAHPNIVNVYDFDRDGDTVFMTMEYMEGKPLDKLISQYRSTGLPEDDAWKILEGISAALVHAHTEQIIHSDFKPGNIFVTNKGVAKVFDFGIARAVASAESLDESVDDKTVFDAGNLGALTPAYASLEMLEGEIPDVRDDIYALGCIAYELFSGRHPFDRVHANEAARRGMKPQRLSVFTKKQWRVIESALSFKREDRVATVEEFWTLLTERTASPVKMIMTIAVLFILAGVVGYQLLFETPVSSFSEDDVRSEIEMQLRLEQHKNNLAELLAVQEFDTTWEDSLWRVVQSLRDLLAPDDVWLAGNESTIYSAYIEKIKVAIAEEQFEFARRIIANASRYAVSMDELVVFEEQLLEAIAAADQRKQEALREQQLAAAQRQVQVAQVQAVAERKSVFNQAMENVNEQLACRTGLNMRDFDIAITKLRELGVADYKKAEPGIVTSLAHCITKIGRSFPERATESKKFAMRVFPSNAAIEAIKIIPKDPCDIGLAGLGASGKRAICRDRLPGADRGPSMVVIPAKGSMNAFAIGKYEVSVEEINSYCSDTKKCTPITSVDKDMPATGLTIDVARGYLAWLSDKAKRTYRLPSKAEWIYAARAESGSLDSNRNCRLNSRGIQKGGVPIRASVGRQNKWGLVNHVGNVQEWVTDVGGVTVAVGGSFDTSMEECTVTLAVPHSGRADSMTGLRVLREILNR